MIDTGLIEEMQVEAIQSLKARGIISTCTRLIPESYVTSIELGFSTLNHYGFTIRAPQHAWPPIASGHAGWLASRFEPITDRRQISQWDFARSAGTEVDETFTAITQSAGVINAVRMSGLAHLAAGMHLGATNAFNGDKIFSAEPLQVAAGTRVRVRVRYMLGGGLSSLKFELSAE